MPEIEVELRDYADIDIEYFYKECSNREKEELIEFLKNDKYFSYSYDNDIIKRSDATMFMEGELFDILLKIWENKYHITKEKLEELKKII
jgi:hypothetical protein